MIPASIHVPGVISTNIPDSINKVFVGSLPAYLNEEHVQELLKSFSELKAFNLVQENGNGNRFAVSHLLPTNHTIGICILQICGCLCY